MLICKVKGNVVATVKDKKFIGHKIMIVRVMNGDGSETSTEFMAVDAIGAGIGETVLVIRHGSSARVLFGPVPFNAVIAGVIDSTYYKDKVFTFK
ncbi:EutN/CcmL family microcompartment protein [Candidatus Dependentiae bacterium]|nr:EutN/CcmL family microcompartment protein [Candidatus Dependentiae bacterium]